MGMNDVEARGGDQGSVHRFTRSQEETTSTAVTLCIADVLDTEVESLRPLSEVLDVDALDALSTTGISIEFEYAGCHVTVRDGTEIRVASNA